MKAFLIRYKKLHLWLAADLAVLALFFLTRQSRAAMNALTGYVTNPLRRMIGRVCELFPFSVAEVLYALLVLGILAFAARGIVRIVRAERKLGALYELCMPLVCTVVTIYALFCLLWGANYYADSFSDKSGLTPEPISVEDLTAVTQQFVDLVNATAAAVPRAEDGTVDVPRADILAYAPQIYGCLYDEFPFLTATDCPPKAMFFSKIMSAMGFTGFYFPFTGESNVNVDFPVATLPSTVAHELAHRRGIASEQECNFLSILASLRCGDEVYAYSGALTGYIYLGNALYSASPDAWREMYVQLDERAVADLRASSAYWAQFEGPVEKASSKVYDGMLKSYGNELGVKSYGACVDLLVAYFKG